MLQHSGHAKQIKTLDNSRLPLKSDRKPVISETILDVESQRFYVWALFTLIQAWKLYDLYILHNESFSEIGNDATGFNYSTNWFFVFSFLHPKLAFVFKYFFLDSLLILIIPFLNIPKLSLTPAFSILILILINFATIVLTFSYSFTFSSLFYSIYRLAVPEKELAIMETYIDTESIINQADHFKGKKTIRYAPDSSIQINPYNQQFCIRPVYNDKIKIPIKLESTYDLQYLQINYHDFNNDDSLLNYTHKELKNFIVQDYYNSPYITYDPSVLADTNVQILEIPITKPGYYSIKMATDKKDKLIRSYRSDTIISVCPEAAFISKPSYSLHKCVDEIIDDLEITLLGVPPFTLYYEEEINGKLSKLPPTIVSHIEKIDSPLNVKDMKKNINKKYASKYLKDITWAKSYNITIPVGEKKLQNSGSYIYTINKVIDGFGNVVNYIPDPSDQSTFASFISHPKPILSLIDAKPAIPILINNDKYLDVKISNVESIKNEGPFNIIFKYTPNENDENYKPETFSQIFDPSKSLNLRIKADKPGTYSIDQGSSNFCFCKIGLSSLNILSAKLPNMTVSLDPIVDNCVGTTGFKFNFDFVGNAPFEIGYKISKLDPNNSNKVIRIEKISSIKSESTTLEYNFNPSSEGSYSIEFINLSDKYYKNQIQFQQGEHRYITYFKQRPKAYFDKFRKVQRLQCCHGGAQEVFLNIEGKAPFNVTYEIISPDYSTQTFNLENIYDNQIPIKTPKFNKGGEYILSLKGVSDSSECEVEFKGQEVHIDVKNDVPQIGFQKNEIFEIARGKNVVVPLRSQSDEPIDLVYSYKTLDGANEQRLKLNNYNPSRGLELSREGIYRLISFKQDKCDGRIVDDYEIQIKFLPLPQLNIQRHHTLSTISKNSFEKAMVCQNQNDEINFEAIGSTPFIIKYEVKYPGGKIEEKIEQINSSKFTLQLATNVHGRYTYTIKDVYDSVYTECALSILRRYDDYKFEKISINHEVSPLPLAKFLENGYKIQTCISNLNDITKLHPINVQLEGDLPISMKVDIYHELDGVLETIELNDLQTSLVDLLTVYEFTNIGTHVISISQIVDANGCVSDETSTHDESIIIQVNDVPKIRHLIEESNQVANFDPVKSTSYYCVGDQITYMLNGIPPFHIKYEFNSIEQQVDVQGNYFKRRAPGPGILNIKSLSDSSARDCSVDYTESGRNDLKAVIYDLPSVEILQGDSIEEDIHEGEQVEIKFVLTGTPPFKLTYIRKELDDLSKIVETEIVEDIMTNEFHIMANLEGTYEAIEIQDKFCVARNHRV
jgi:nucleoporin POM152